MAAKVNIFWFRRDLRLEDNTALYHALQSGIPVLPVFIFDKNILKKLDDKKDGRVSFIHLTLLKIQKQLTAKESSLLVMYDTPENAFRELLSEYEIDTVYSNRDYESYAIQRDRLVTDILQQAGVKFLQYKDHVIFEKSEIVKDDGRPYSVFTPYSRKWRSIFIENPLQVFPSEKYLKGLQKIKPQVIPTLKQIGFEQSALPFPSPDISKILLSAYHENRNFPGINGTSKLGIHLRFGTVSVRKIASTVSDLSASFLNELIWRDFYQMILWHHPRLGHGASFKPAYDQLEWRRDTGEFEKWCLGKTGYPIVDAGMRELNATGFMHNRVRMITASFLCKHLLLDWRLGEAYFAEKLLDFEFASNNGGWQWASGSGCDAVPYFRIFNPALQTKKFDPDYTYIRKWVPEFNTKDYPFPLVDHVFARKRCLEMYAKALKNKL